MSQEAVARFLELVESDPAVESAMNAAAPQGADVAAVAVAIGEAHGLAFTADEFAAAVQAFHREHSGELDDAELAGVSGGLNPQPEPPMTVTGFSSTLPWFSQSWSKPSTFGH
jgi:hypothetical protein